MFTKHLLATALAGATMAVAGIATASLTIINTAPTNQEVTGDPGGTVYPWPGGPGGGAGIPSQLAGWPIGPGFAADSSFGGALGTSGWHGAYLQLDSPDTVTFQFMGGGNSSNVNSFWLDLNGINNPGGWTELFQDSHLGAPTDPCPVGPVSTVPQCDNLGGGFPVQNQYSFFLPAGLIPFAFDINGLGGPINLPGTDWNVVNGTSSHPGATGNPDNNVDLPGFFLGIDPYAPFASAPFQMTGNAAYAGLTDLPGPGDHDFQDMAVRISVPEPGSLLLLAGGLLALAGFRRRRA